jgi:hypothetical protein
MEHDDPNQQQCVAGSRFERPEALHALPLPSTQAIAEALKITSEFERIRY